MLVLLIVCLMKLIEMYTNNNKMARNKSARNAKENHFGYQNINSKKQLVPDESFAERHDGDRYSMNYFYDVDQSCVDQLKEFLHQKSGNESTLSAFDTNGAINYEPEFGFRIPSR